MANYNLIAPEGANLDCLEPRRLMMRSLFASTVFKDNGDLKDKFMALRRFG